MDVFDTLELALALVKDRLTETTRRELRESCMQTLKAEADARRSKMACDVLRMAKLQIAVKKLERQYALVTDRTGKILCIEDLIRSANREIQIISMRKNK